MKADLKKEIALPDGCTAVLLPGNTLRIAASKGEVKRCFLYPRIAISVQERKIVLQASAASKREKTILGSFASHIKNMVRGVQEPFEYRLKVCSGHFPMSVAVSGDEVVLKNFFGENTPRKVKILPGAAVKIADKEVLVSSPDKETAGNMAGRIEKMCSISKRDRRIFMDGIWITEKGGRKL